METVGLAVQRTDYGLQFQVIDANMLVYSTINYTDEEAAQLVSIILKKLSTARPGAAVCGACRHDWSFHKDVSEDGRKDVYGNLVAWACTKYAGMGDYCGCDEGK